MAGGLVFLPLCADVRLFGVAGGVVVGGDGFGCGEGGDGGAVGGGGVVALGGVVLDDPYQL